jgi:hypothetical protein
MPVRVQARLDRETHRALNRLVRRLGMSPSALVREVFVCWRLAKKRRRRKRSSAWVNSVPELPIWDLTSATSKDSGVRLVLLDTSRYWASATEVKGLSKYRDSGEVLTLD